MEKQKAQLLQGIDTIIVRVSDIELSKKWYQDQLELESIWDDPKLKLVVLNTNGPTSLTLWQTSENHTINRETASYPIFKTLDATILREELKSRGVETGDLIQDDYVKYFFFFDPDGNVLEACQVHE